MSSILEAPNQADVREGCRWLDGTFRVTGLCRRIPEVLLRDTLSPISLCSVDDLLPVSRVDNADVKEAQHNATGLPALSADEIGRAVAVQAFSGRTGLFTPWKVSLVIIVRSLILSF